LKTRLFQSQPSVLRAYQHRFRYILVDEFQDINTAQYRLISLLAADHHNMEATMPYFIPGPPLFTAKRLILWIVNGVFW